LRSSPNRHVPQFLMGRYWPAEITGPEVIMTTIPKPMGRRAYKMRGDSVSALLHHLFTV
jgi:hypothetical protein